MSLQRPVVAHLIDRYLPGTETFIYQYLIHILRYRPVVVVPFGDHPEQFPFPELHIPDMSVIRRSADQGRIGAPFIVNVWWNLSASELSAHREPSSYMPTSAPWAYLHYLYDLR